MVAVVLVAGVSCSGKTTLARRLAAETDAAYISIDDYYRPFADLPLHQRKQVNFDSPEAIEHELLVNHVTLLRGGETAHKPMYDAAAFERLRGTEPIYANPLVVIEGLFALYWPELREQASLSVFVETPLETCRQRRFDRDVSQYGRSPEDSIQRYVHHVQPNQERYVLSTKHYSDLLVAGDHPLEHALAEIQRTLSVALRG